MLAVSASTVPIADILSGKNVRAWVSMVLYLKKLIKIKILKRKNILGAVSKLPAKKHSQSSPIWVKIGWIGCAI